MDAQQQFDTIEAYLAGELKGSALAEFEQEIKADAALATVVEEHRIGHDAIELLIESDLRKELDFLRAEANSTSTTKVVQMPTVEAPATTVQGTAKRRSLFPRLAAAASVILLIGFFALQLGTSSNVLDEHYLEYPMPSVNRSGEATDLHLLATGLGAYKSGNYTEAINYYKSIPVEDKRYNEAQFYLGHSYHHNSNYTAASTAFAKVAASKDIRFMEKAEWYQLLALLANKQQDTTFKTLLNKMIDDKGHSYHQQAQKLNADL